jgi:endonuclease-3 related protein
MKKTVTEIYEFMEEKMGKQNWWPKENWEETILGSILIQNASAKTVDPVVEAIKERCDGISLARLSKLRDEEIEELIKPAGLYRTKTNYLRAAMNFFGEYDFDLTVLEEMDTPTLRKLISGIKGIGSETRDVWLVYIFSRSIFIADSYSRRLFTYLGVEKFLTGKVTYESLAKFIHENSSFTPDEAREFHALIDEFGKLYLQNEEKFQTSFMKEIELVKN